MVSETDLYLSRLREQRWREFEAQAYTIIRGEERKRLDPIPDAEIARAFGVTSLDCEWLTNRRPEVLDAVRRAQSDVANERRLW